MTINYQQSTINNQLGFTLIELLVVISIIGILMALSIFGIQGARESSRDARRKADLELIRSGLEIYKSDCGDYPAALTSPLVGDGSPASCATTNTYISTVPTDPTSPARTYLYSRPTTSTYEMCAALEQGSGTVTCGGSSNCGETCNYKVTNP
jgi:general secretion pathway protein G